jgi:signal transduction histidine kinase
MAGELRQVILNLIGNALDASSHGGRLKIRVSNTREHSNGARPGVRLTVADTGSGISPEMRRTLFEPFVSTKGDTGTGLGLWISSEIVRRHSGKIQVRSSSLSQSSWTVFSVFLPLIQNRGGTLATVSTTLDGKGKEAQSDSSPAMVLPRQRAMVI